MGCPKNIIQKKFLFWKWHTEGSHNFEPYRYSTFVRFDDDFIIHSKCTHCGTPREEKFISYEEMIRRGFTEEQLSKIQRSYFGVGSHCI